MRQGNMRGALSPSIEGPGFRSVSQAKSSPAPFQPCIAILLFVIGWGTLVPFNAMVNCVDYFVTRFDLPSVEYYVAIAFAVSQPFVTFVTSKVGETHAVHTLLR